MKKEKGHIIEDLRELARCTMQAICEEDTIYAPMYIMDLLHPLEQKIIILTRDQEPVKTCGERSYKEIGLNLFETASCSLPAFFSLNNIRLITNS